LDRHNRLRALACVPPLKWNPYLAQVANNYGQQCIMAHNAARTTDYETALRNAGQPVPSSNTADYPDCSAVGENIASSSMFLVHFMIYFPFYSFLLLFVVDQAFVFVISFLFLLDVLIIFLLFSIFSLFYFVLLD
jgi:hypothetical protein